MTPSEMVLTFASAKTALAEGLHAIEAGRGEFDLSSLASVDSASVAILLAWQRAAQARGTPIQFRNPPPALLSLAALYGVSELLPFTESKKT
jgi:phospholipid transport system transporter-binding protein